MVKIFDENAREIISEKFKEVNNLQLVAAAFDNEAILLKFIVTGSSDIEMKYYTISKAKEFRSVNKPTLNEKDGYVNFNIGGPETINTNLYGVPDKGFLNYAPYKESKTEGYEIILVGSKGEKKWSYQSQTKSGEKDIANILTIGKNNVYSVISGYGSSKKFNLMGGHYITQSINSIDLSTGRKLFETRMEDEQFSYQICSGQESEAGLIVFGLYYPKSVKMDISEPWGMFTATLDRNGNILTKKIVNLDNDVSKFFPLESYKSLNALGNIYFHNFLQISDGKIFAIAENYGVGNGLANTNFLGVKKGNSSYTFRARDLFIFEFNPDFTISGIKAFHKSLTRISMSSNNFVTPPVEAANIMKSQWGFGYLYTQVSPDKSSFIVCYKDIVKEERSNLINLEAIVYKDKTYTSDKLNLKVDNNILTPFPAKYGHIFLSGYLKDEKKQEMRLERINF